MATATLKDKRIAIFEDDPENRSRWADLVKMCGGRPLTVAPPAPKLENLVSFLASEKVSLVMCDNRLFEHGNYAQYYGAEAVATSYKSGRGGVLVTAYENDDAELSIREHRRWIPSLLHATELRGSILKSALLQADCEAREKQTSRERVPHRTIMTIRRVVVKGGQSIVKVLMCQWNPTSEVGFPLDMLPRTLQAQVAPGKMLLAQVNIEAVRAEDLFFDQFETPDPDVLKKSETLFGST